MNKLLRSLVPICVIRHLPSKFIHPVIYVNKLCKFFTVTTHEHHTVSDHWESICLFMSRFWQTDTKSSSSASLFLYDDNILGTSGFLSQKASNVEKVAYHDIIMSRSRYGIYHDFLNNVSNILVFKADYFARFNHFESLWLINFICTEVHYILTETGPDH